MLSPATIDEFPAIIWRYKSEETRKNYRDGRKIVCKSSRDDVEICSGLKGYRYGYNLPSWWVKFKENLKSDLFSSEGKDVYEVDSQIYNPQRPSKIFKYGYVLYNGNPFEDENFSRETFLLNPLYLWGEKLLYLKNNNNLSQQELFEYYGLKMEQELKNIDCKQAQIFGEDLSCYSSGIVIAKWLLAQEQYTFPVLIIKNEKTKHYFLRIISEMISAQFSDFHFS